MTPTNREAFEATVAALRAFADRTGLRIVFAYLPSQADLLPSGGDHGSQIEKALLREDFTLIDLSPVLSSNDYFLYDGHWTPGGHERVAAEILRELRERRLIERS